MADTTNVGSITTEKRVYRKYVKYGIDKESGKSVITETSVMAESDSKAKSGLATNWQNAEDAGFILFSENDVITYSVKNEAAFAELVPSPEQRMYIIAAGLSTIQTARANAFMKPLKENTPEPEPEYNQVELDLRTGIGEDEEYSLNKAPSRKTTSPLEKIKKIMAALNLSPEDQAEMLLSLASGLTSEDKEAATEAAQTVEA